MENETTNETPACVEIRNRNKRERAELTELAMGLLLIPNDCRKKALPPNAFDELKVLDSLGIEREARVLTGSSVADFSRNQFWQLKGVECVPRENGYLVLYPANAPEKRPILRVHVYTCGAHCLKTLPGDDKNDYPVDTMLDLQTQFVCGKCGNNKMQKAPYCFACDRKLRFGEPFALPRQPRNFVLPNAMWGRAIPTMPSRDSAKRFLKVLYLDRGYNSALDRRIWTFDNKNECFTLQEASTFVGHTEESSGHTNIMTSNLAEIMSTEDFDAMAPAFVNAKFDDNETLEGSLAYQSGAELTRFFKKYCDMI